MCVYTYSSTSCAFIVYLFTYKKTATALYVYVNVNTCVYIYIYLSIYLSLSLSLWPLSVLMALTPPCSDNFSQATVFQPKPCSRHAFLRGAAVRVLFGEVLQCWVSDCDGNINSAYPQVSKKGSYEALEPKASHRCIQGARQTLTVAKGAHRGACHGLGSAQDWRYYISLSLCRYHFEVFLK